MPSKEVSPNTEQCFDQNAAQYDCVRRAVFEYHECFTVLSQLPEMQGKEVLDLGCGTGLYTRLLRSLGATSVTGIDLSEEMLSIARRQENETCSIIQYEKQDILQWIPEHRYDLVFSSYILNYAHNRQELVRMLEKMRDSLAANGRLVIILDIFGLRCARDYGESVSDFTIYHDQPLSPYDSFRLTLKDSDTPIMDIYSIYIDPVELYQMLREVGFTGIQYQQPLLAPEIWDHLSIECVTNLACYPYFMVISASRPDV